MTTPVFENFATNVVVNSPREGSRPIFVSNKNFDARGYEKKEAPKPGQEPPQNQSFFSKYWMYILAAFVILPRLFEAPEGAQGGAGGGGGGGAQS